MGRWIGLVGIALIGILGLVGQGETASAKEIRFIAGEPATDRSIWQPGAGVIDQKNDLKEPLYFILENPTGTDHESAVHGLYTFLPDWKKSGGRYEDIGGQRVENVLAPIHALVKAKSTLKIEVSTEGLIGRRDLGARYPFFCPIHKDLHLGGVIFVD